MKLKDTLVRVFDYVHKLWLAPSGWYEIVLSTFLTLIYMGIVIGAVIFLSLFFGSWG